MRENLVLLEMREGESLIADLIIFSSFLRRIRIDLFIRTHIYQILCLGQIIISIHNDNLAILINFANYYMALDLKFFIQLDSNLLILDLKRLLLKSRLLTIRCLIESFWKGFKALNFEDFFIGSNTIRKRWFTINFKIIIYAKIMDFSWVKLALEWLTTAYWLINVFRELLLCSNQLPSLMYDFKAILSLIVCTDNEAITKTFKEVFVYKCLV